MRDGQGPMLETSDVFRNHGSTFLTSCPGLMTMFRCKSNAFFPPPHEWEYQNWEGEWAASSLMVEEPAAFIHEPVVYIYIYICDLIYTAGVGPDSSTVCNSSFRAGVWRG